MDAADFFERAFATLPAMVILRGSEPAETVRQCERAAEFGVRLIEIPLQSAQSRQALEAAVAWGAGKPEVTIGTGTITSRPLLREAATLGARFSVAPGFDPDVLAESRRLDLPHLPGVATGTEIQQAMRHGCTWVKAFPAAALGPVWFSAMRGPFPQIRLVATGGVDDSNAAELLRAGASAVVFGSSFARLGRADFEQAFRAGAGGG